MNTRCIVLTTCAMCVTLATAAEAQESAVDRLQAAQMCTDRVERARAKPEFMKWTRKLFFQEPGKPEPTPALNEKWAVRSHFNAERLRCLMAVSVELPPGDDDPNGTHILIERIWDAYDLNQVANSMVVKGKHPLEMFRLFGDETDKDCAATIRSAA